MFADTDAIRAFGAANSAHAADLAAVAAALPSTPDPGALGPVGTRFLMALDDATTEASRAIAALGDRLTAGHRTAQASAAAYENADHRLASRL